MEPVSSAALLSSGYESEMLLITPHRRNLVAAEVMNFDPLYVKQALFN
jgi:hypothetical protein